MTDRVPPLQPPDAPGPAGGVLVIGYGNSLRGDDGVGPRVVELVAADPRVAGVTAGVAGAPAGGAGATAGDRPGSGIVVLAVHQLTPELALDMSAADLVVLVDATTAVPPGVVVVRRLDPGGEAGATGGATSHHVGPGVLLSLARDLYGAAPEAHVVSVGVADMETGEGLSPPVAAAVPAAVDAVTQLVAAHLESRSG